MKPEKHMKEKKTDTVGDWKECTCGNTADWHSGRELQDTGETNQTKLRSRENNKESTEETR